MSQITELPTGRTIYVDTTDTPLTEAGAYAVAQAAVITAGFLHADLSQDRRATDRRARK